MEGVPTPPRRQTGAHAAEIEKKQNEARHLRRMVSLFRACCNSCNQAAEALGLTREVLAYYRDRITLERALAAAQQREAAVAAEAAAAATAAAAEAAAAAAWDNESLGLF